MSAIRITCLAVLFLIAGWQEDVMETPLGQDIHDHSKHSSESCMAKDMGRFESNEVWLPINHSKRNRICACCISAYEKSATIPCFLKL